MTRVVLVDDHQSFRQALAYMFEQEPDMTVVGQAGDISAARPLLRRADVVVVDLDLGGESGLELIGDLRAAHPRVQILVLTGSRSRQDFAVAIEAGAAGVLHKSAEISEIVEGVRKIARGEYLLTPAEAVSLMREAVRHREQLQAAQHAADRLTPREQEVLAELAHGLSDKEIAERLSMTPETVRTHMVNIHSKLGVHSRLQALVFAVRHGLVEIE